jgi:uncharacterized protein (TIGR02145 family)
MKKLFYLFGLLIVAIILTGCFSMIQRSLDRALGIDPSQYTDEGVEIDGIRWATRNADMLNLFAKNPEDAGKLFQWNRQAHWSTGDGGGIFDTTSESELRNWDSSAPEGSEWTLANNPCPIGWRVPTREEFRSLINSGRTQATLNGVSGLLFGTAPNQIFLPVVRTRNNRNNGRLAASIPDGAYWSSTSAGDSDTEARILFFEVKDSFGNSIADIRITERANGLSVRCVAK